MYLCKKMLSGLGMKYVTIDVCPDNFMLFYKEHAKENKCLKCGQLRFVEVVNEDDNKVMTEVTHKNVHYFPITARLSRLFISKRTTKHMRWYKEGVHENNIVMVHTSDSEPWKALNNSYVNFTSDVRNVRIGLVTDNFDPFGTNSATYSYWPIFTITYNLSPSFCMKYVSVFCTDK
jgi:hypothetical protein